MVNKSIQSKLILVSNNILLINFLSINSIHVIFPFRFILSFDIILIHLILNSYGSLPRFNIGLSSLG